MEAFRQRHALRVVVLAWALAWVGSAGELAARTGEATDPTELTGRSGEPFGLLAINVSSGAIRDKWIELERRLADDRVQLALCDGDRESCVSPAALRLLTIVDGAKAREGRARLGEINRAVNLAIKPMSDLAQYGAIDAWSSPLTTFANGAGDCEDYAIAKFIALRQAGVSEDDLRIVIVRDIVRGEDHAVAAARLEGRWLMLDNRRMAMIEDIQFRNSRPLFVIDQQGVMQYADPLVASTPSRGQRSPIASYSSTQPGSISRLN